jgi:formiminotetrahydrofolate cyclodeaminase
MAAALGAMVTRLAKLPSGGFEEDRRFFTGAVERASEAFQRAMAAHERAKEERGPFVEEALHGAAEVPLEVLERASAMLTRLAGLQIPVRFASDLAVAKALAAAAKTGTLANVRMNLSAIQDPDFRASVESRLRALSLGE